MKKKIIAMLLALATLWLCAVPAFAAKEELFISDVAVIYEDSVEDALEKIEGTEWKLLSQDLNKDADLMFDDGVYLIYKTTTNVEEAITDLRVMNMYGGYNFSDYEAQLEKSYDEYVAMMTELRLVADEFAALYAAGDKMAQLAYRQMNYYKDIGETDMLMGDYFLEFPSNEKAAEMMMQGNAIVTTNLLLLLVIGTSRSGADALISKIPAFYDVKDTLTDEEHYDVAKDLVDDFGRITDALIKYDALKDNFDLTDEDSTDEEIEFVSEYANIAAIAESIKYGEVTLKTFLTTTEWTAKDLYPIVAAMTPAQRILSGLGLMDDILLYGYADKDYEALEAIIEAGENGMMDENGNIAPIDVYLGVDRTIFEGGFAFTNAAERKQAQTGSFWSEIPMWDESLEKPALILTGLSVGIVVVTELIKYPILAAVKWVAFDMPVYLSLTWLKNAAVTIETLIIKFKLNFVYSGFIYTVALGLALIAAGMIGISWAYNYFNPNYLEIPATMIDVRETEQGDKYVKYTAAGVYGAKDGRLADFNAYQGKEWIALYYTKDATAGNCLTPNFRISSDNSSVARRYQGVSMFGETKAYDLNSHTFGVNAPETYLSVRYSNTKKAAADMPDVVGTILGAGGYALAAGLGLGVGVGIMGFVGAKRKKKEIATAA